ncbi:MAG: hypothetical protein V4619_02625 [Bacteroidota bacterium]
MKNKFNDIFLEGMVSAMNAVKGQIGITLTISGFIVTGKLISGSEYFDILIKQNKGGILEDSFLNSKKAYILK